MKNLFFVSLWDMPGWMLVSIGFYVSYRVLKFPDLTVDASFVTATCGAAIAATLYDSSLIGIVFASILSGFSGLMTALIYLSNPRPAYKLLAGALILFVSYSINFRVLGHATESTFDKTDTFMNKISIYEIQHGLYPYKPITLLVGIFLVFFVCCVYFWFLRTNAGLVFRTIGPRSNIICNKGFRRGKILILGLIITNVTVGFGGWYQASIDGFAQIILFGTILHALAAAILGEILFERIKIFGDRRGSVTAILAAPIVGAFLYQLIQTGVQYFFINESMATSDKIISVNQQDSNTFIAGLIILIVLGVRFLTLKSQLDEGQGEEVS
ncbi:MAG: hypothetical protein HGB06_05480 [Chlorobaculum sp.]|jgi:putative ABC transport system permease protein|nr:hypothetical protein [Chlorobaculum sp.]